LIGAAATKLIVSTHRAKRLVICMFASSTLEFSYFQRSSYLKKDELNGIGGGKGFVARRLVRLYTGLGVGGYALLSRLLPLLDKARFAALHR
jgi:hypothetical protein